MALLSRSDLLLAKLRRRFLHHLLGQIDAYHEPGRSHLCGSGKASVILRVHEWIDLPGPNHDKVDTQHSVLAPRLLPSKTRAGNGFPCSVPKKAVIVVYHVDSSYLLHYYTQA